MPTVSKVSIRLIFMSRVKPVEKHQESTPTPTTQPSTGSIELLGSVDGVPQGSADLGYSLVSDSNTFVGLQEVCKIFTWVYLSTPILTELRSSGVMNLKTSQFLAITHYEIH